MKMKSLINLPEDVLNNRILLKLDTKSLMNLRCVCKYLRSLITSPAFVKMHYNNQLNNNPQVLVYNDKHHLYASINFNNYTDIDPSRVEIASRFSISRFSGSCNGLLCLIEKENYPPSLWNPTTKEYKNLPPSLPALLEDVFGSNLVRKQFCHDVAYGFGYDRIINDYKVIQCQNFRGIMPNMNYSIIEFQVYTLGTNTWRRITDNSYQSHFTTRFYYNTPGVFVNGATHWILREKEYSESKIIALDIEKEIFRAEVPKPHSRLSDFCNDKWSLQVLKGCLCMYGIQSFECHIWMMTDYGVMDSWTKLFTFAIPCCYDLKVLNFCENGEFLVAIMGLDYRSLEDLILYEPINKKSKRVFGEEILDIISYIEIHIESLGSLYTGIYRSL